MDCPEAKKTKRGEVAVACPPDDSLVEILSRLHAKTLFRFKCVSKDWCNLIADRLRCRKFPFPQTLEGFFTDRGAENYGGFIDVLETPVPFIDPSFSFLTKLPEIKKPVLLDSCNGLVLFENRQGPSRYDLLGYIVCNPATEQWVSVPNSFPWGDSDDEDEDNPDYGTETYLIFDPAISPHFQLIQLRPEVLFGLDEMLTLSSVTGGWRLEGALALTLVGTAVCPFSGILHVLANQPDRPGHWSMIHAVDGEGRTDQPGHWNSILAVGGEGRPFRTLHWPQKDRSSPVFIGQCQGHLHCLSGCRGDNSQLTEQSIWVLEDYNAEKWVLRDNVSFSQLFGRMSARFHLDWNVVAIHPDRSLVFFVHHWDRKMISYDMDSKEVHALCTLGHHCQSVTPYVPYFAESAVLAKKH